MTRQHTPLSQRLGQGHGHGLGLSPAKRTRTFQRCFSTFTVSTRCEMTLIPNICAYIGVTRLGPQHKSPLALKLQAKRGTNRLLSRKAPALPTILEEEEEGEEDAAPYDRKRHDYGRSIGRRSMKAKAQDLLAGIDEESEDAMDWEDEATLVALLQDE